MITTNTALKVNFIDATENSEVQHQWKKSGYKGTLLEFMDGISESDALARRAAYKSYKGVEPTVYPSVTNKHAWIYAHECFTNHNYKAACEAYREALDLHNASVPVPKAPAFDAACMTVSKNATTITTKLLTKTQLAVIADLSSLDVDGLRLIHSNGRGASQKGAGAIIGTIDMDNAFTKYEKSGCTNVKDLAILIRSILNKFTDSKKLSVCPTSKAAGFFDYPGQVAYWVEATENEKTKTANAKLAAMVYPIISRAKLIADNHYSAMQAEREAVKLEKASREAMQAEREAMQAERATMVLDTVTYSLDRAF